MSLYSAQLYEYNYLEALQHIYIHQYHLYLHSQLLVDDPKMFEREYIYYFMIFFEYEIFQVFRWYQTFAVLLFGKNHVESQACLP